MFELINGPDIKSNEGYCDALADQLASMDTARDLLIVRRDCTVKTLHGLEEYCHSIAKHCMESESSYAKPLRTVALEFLENGSTGIVIAFTVAAAAIMAKIIHWIWKTCTGEGKGSGKAASALVSNQARKNKLKEALAESEALLTDMKNKDRWSKEAEKRTLEKHPDLVHNNPLNLVLDGYKFNTSTADKMSIMYNLSTDMLDYCDEIYNNIEKNEKSNIKTARWYNTLEHGKWKPTTTYTGKFNERDLSAELVKYYNYVTDTSPTGAGQVKISIVDIGSFIFQDTNMKEAISRKDTAAERALSLQKKFQSWVDNLQNNPDEYSKYTYLTENVKLAKNIMKASAEIERIYIFYLQVLNEFTEALTFYSHEYVKVSKENKPE